jgi:hypothetical protein
MRHSERDWQMFHTFYSQFLSQKFIKRSKRRYNCKLVYTKRILPGIKARQNTIVIEGTMDGRNDYTRGTVSLGDAVFSLLLKFVTKHPSFL